MPAPLDVVAPPTEEFRQSAAASQHIVSYHIVTRTLLGRPARHGAERFEAGEVIVVRM